MFSYTAYQSLKGSECAEKCMVKGARGQKALFLYHTIIF